MRHLDRSPITTTFGFDHTAPPFCAGFANRATGTPAASIDRRDRGIRAPSSSRLTQIHLDMLSCINDAVPGIASCWYSTVARLTTGTSAVCGAMRCAGQ
ncbi:hypothetical protein M3J09_011948 [Ascochyta lentis]